MSEVKIKRRQRNVSITLSTSTISATTLRLDDMAGAVLSMGTVSTNASTLHIYAAEAEDGSYRRLYDNAGSPANITLAASTSEGHAYSFPMRPLPYRGARSLAAIPTAPALQPWSPSRAKNYGSQRHD
jgi:hypothetical protein